MQALTRPYGVLHYRTDGPTDAPAVILANSLGTDLRLWDALLPLLPTGLRYIRYDKQGHGLSSLGEGTAIDHHAADAIALIEAVAKKPVVFVGVSIGGLIAQAVAGRRPDLVRAVILSNTAAKLGTAESWQARIDAIAQRGLEHIADGIMERWFAPAFRATPDLALWRNMLVRTPADGYIAACTALSRADESRTTAGLRIPALVVAGEADGASPAEVVKATADLIREAEFHVVPGVGHLPCVEAPTAYAALLSPFLKAHAHD